MRTPAWLKGTLLLSMTLGAGVVIGIAWERQSEARSHGQPLTHGEAAVEAHDIMHRFHHELGLDSSQHQRIASILTHHQHALDSTWHTLQPHVRAALDSTLQEIMAVLRPDQQPKYRRMVEQLHPGVLRH